MAYLVRLDTVRTRVRERVHLETSTFVTDTEANRLINVHRRRLQFRLARNVPSFFASDASLSVVAGTIAYTLPADFMSLQAVWVVEGSRYRPLRGMNDVQRSVLQAPMASCTVAVRYTPHPVDLVADSDTFDAYTCADEWIVCACARSIRVKEETDLSGVSLEMQDLENDILSSLSMRDAATPEYVTEVEYRDAYPYLSVSNLDSYQLRGSGVSGTFLDLYSFTAPAWA